MSSFGRSVGRRPKSIESSTEVFLGWSEFRGGVCASLTGRMRFSVVCTNRVAGQNRQLFACARMETHLRVTAWKLVYETRRLESVSFSFVLSSGERRDFIVAFAQPGTHTVWPNPIAIMTTIERRAPPFKKTPNFKLHYPWHPDSTQPTSEN